MAATPFTVQGTFNLPGTPGLPLDPIPFGMSSAYDAKTEFELNIPNGSGTLSVPFGSVPNTGAKLVLIQYVQLTGAPPLLLKFNGSTIPIELTTGGFVLFGNPSPSAGIYSLDMVYSGAGRARIWLLG